MPRGSKPGERRGGRQKGTPNANTRVSREIADKAMTEGISPLEVMLGAMRQHWAEAEKLVAEKPDAALIDQILGYRKVACDIAKDAAPYCHPRLAAIEHTGADGSPLLAAITVSFVKADGSG